jgi:hypothetical protein
MELEQYVDKLRHDLAVAARAGGDEARELADRLTEPLEASIRLVLLEALSTAAADNTRDLAPGSVDLRLRGREPSFVVTPPPTDTWSDEPTPVATPTPTDGDEEANARINFRLPEHLKSRIEQAASQAGLSINSWLIRAATTAVSTDGQSQQQARRAPRGGDRLTGWVR